MLGRDKSSPAVRKREAKSIKINGVFNISFICAKENGLCGWENFSVRSVNVRIRSVKHVNNQ